MVQGVIGRTKGTMPETEGIKTPEVKGKTPEGTQVSPQEDVPIYNQKQADALLHAERSEWGRKVAAIEQERDTLKSQMQSKDAEIEANAEDIKGLEAKLDDMTSDDPKRFEVVSELKAARQERRELKSQKANQDERESKLSEREKRVNSFEREVLIESIADEYEDGDASKLKKAVSLFDNPTEENIRTYPEIFGWKLKAEGEGEPPKAPKAYSGKTEGGGDNLASMSPKDRAIEADRRLRSK